MNSESRQELLSPSDVKRDAGRNNDGIGGVNPIAGDVHAYIYPEMPNPCGTKAKPAANHQNAARMEMSNKWTCDTSFTSLSQIEPTHAWMGSSEVNESY